MAGPVYFLSLVVIFKGAFPCDLYIQFESMKARVSLLGWDLVGIRGETSKVSSETINFMVASSAPLILP